MGMELGGCAKCSKYLLIVFNVLFFLVGIALLAAGIWVIVQPYQLEILEILNNPLIKNSAYLLIALGSFIIVVAALGCCGACMNSKCLLVVYFIIILIIFIAQLVGCALVLAYRSEVNKFVSEGLATTMDDYKGESANDTLSTAWNGIQILLECCGTNGYGDWADGTWVNTTSPMIEIGGSSYPQEYPATCCVFEDKYTILEGGVWPTPVDLALCMGRADDGSEVTPTNATLNKGGCFMAFEDLVIGQIAIVGGVGIGLLVFELLSMAFAIILCRGISKGEDVV
ncbi:tetraspanin isoform X1 [Strongylocentrotus purpuratus]|uniref:Tetraspanin n=2 Tax=Strongylocentrotus purpuratus TaxID=7668 RepID=A0A7M6UC86_STRPU|nr:tetraspanin [Strongylocentrotus purpuratus]XP_030844647.1 tetraspanin isoform X1 [Strongylocentrotus purpuratus]|eukprot:NP_001118229.1 tetraspanin [Strongylocentrotus purpuratus]